MAKTDRLHQLDGLRALAVALVMIHHIGGASLATSLQQRGHGYLAAAVASSTASGVELFFVLSGIVLLRPYFRQHRPLQVAVYAQRRVQRLWPPFLAAWLVAGLTTWLASRYPTAWTQSASLAEFEWQSWLAQIGIVYLGNNAFNAAWWSLSVELLFYALVPLIVIWLTHWKPSRTQLVYAWLVSVALAIVAHTSPSFGLPQLAWPIPRFVHHISCFATGILIAAFDIPRTWAKRLALAGGAYVLVGCGVPSLSLHVGWGLVYFALVTVALDSSSKVAQVLSWWPFVWLGERSYSLFLVHMSAFTLVSHVVSVYIPSKGVEYYVLSRLLQVPVALFAAMVIFSVVERRFARGLVTANAFWPSLKPPASSSLPVAET